MRLSTHYHKTHKKTPKYILILLLSSIGLMYFVFILGTLACYFYAHSMLGSILFISIPTVLIVLTYITMRDINKAYVEINRNSVLVVDYYFGIKKEQLFSFSDITYAEVVSAYSRKVKGYRYSFMGQRYIILKKNK